MIRRGARRRSSRVDKTRDHGGDVSEWALSLPWVVERPTDGVPSGVRLFAVDCALLGRRQLWLITGLGQTALGGSEGTDIAAVMSTEAIRAATGAGWEVLHAEPLPAGNVLVTLTPELALERDEIEAFVLAAYSYAML